MKLSLRKHHRAVSGIAAIVLLAGVVFIRWGNDIARALESDRPSHSLGTTAKGTLIYGKRLPTNGANFQAYGYLPVALGRSSLHYRVRAVVLDAYAAMAKTYPSVRFVYGECGWPSGGRLRPHATHQNGLSVDFMVPVKNSAGPSVLKTSIFNKYGYSVYFDEQGHCEAQDCSIDFDAMAAHLTALKESADRHGLKIWRVIFASELQSHLFETETGRSLPDTMAFSKKPSWVRHDEHYHVDFENPDQDETADHPLEAEGE